MERQSLSRCQELQLWDGRGSVVREALPKAVKQGPSLQDLSEHLTDYCVLWVPEKDYVVLSKPILSLKRKE